MYKLKLLLLPVAWLLAFMALACAPPDDDDRSSGPSSGPSINNAIYDFATALLTVQGTDLSPTEAQIQTIVVDGVALDSYTADDPATGPDSNGLAKGKYRMKSDGTELWLRLTDKDKATLEAKVGSNGRKDGLLSVGSGAWAGLDTAKDLTVRNIPDKQSKVSDDNQPSKQTEEAEQDEQAEEVEQAEDKQSHELPEAEQTEEVEDKQSKTETEEQSPKQPKAEEQSPKAAITRASYHVGTALLTVQGTHLGNATQAQIQTIKVYDLVLNSYTADGTATGADSSSLAKGKYRMKSDGTALWLYLTDQHKTTLNGKDGMDSNGLKDGLLTSTGSWAGLDTAKALTVSGNPAITGASYHVGTALLTLQGTLLASATQAQIQTITVDGVALDSYTATATGPDSRGLAKGKYRMKSDGTALWLYLTDRHKTTLNGKPGMDSNGLKDGLLTSTGTWAGLDTAKALAVSGNPPAITSATYHVGTALLTVQGSNLSPTTATQAQIQTITVDGIALDSYTADGTATGPDSRGLAKGKYRLHSDGTALWLYLTDDDKATLNGKTGMDSNGRKDRLLSVGTGAWAGLDTAKDLTVSGNPPAITRATYNAATGVLVITGTNLPKAVTGWDFTKLRFVAGNGRKSQPLQNHNPIGFTRATGSAASTTSLTITLKGYEVTKATDILVKNGDSDDTGAYNLEAAAGFAGGSAADTSNNPITVSGYVSQITNLVYNSRTGLLFIKGSRLPPTVAEWDFSKLTIVSGDGSKKYTLPQHTAAGENTATGSDASTTSVRIILSGSVKAEANKILVKVGKSDNDGAYNLEAAAGFGIGSPAVPTNAIQVVNW